MDQNYKRIHKLLSIVLLICRSTSKGHRTGLYHFKTIELSLRWSWSKFPQFHTCVHRFIRRICETLIVEKHLMWFQIVGHTSAIHSILLMHHSTLPLLSPFKTHERARFVQLFQAKILPNLIYINSWSIVKLEPWLTSSLCFEKLYTVKTKSAKSVFKLKSLPTLISF